MRSLCSSVIKVALQRVLTAPRFSSAVLTAGLIAAFGWPASAVAEPSDDSLNDTLTAIGLGDNGALSTAIADAGRELCPKLVKPGSSLAVTASQLQGNSGLAPEIAGMVTGLAIQLQCPALMASIARGELPEMLLKQAEKDSPAMPFPLPGGAR